MSFITNEICVRILKEKYKYIPNISKVVDEGFFLSPKSIKLFKFITENMRKPIPDSAIQLFYDNPVQFFSSSKILLANTSFYDNSGNSIFAHYFNVLNSKNNRRFETEIYEKNFANFFKGFINELTFQDYGLDTPLHKLAKFKNKIFFLEICQKLYDLGILNEELLTIKNVDSKSCYDIIIDDIIENKKKIIQNNFQIYKNFIEFYPNLKNSLSDGQKSVLTSFLTKLIFDEQYYQEIKINETIDRFNSFLNNLKEKKTFFKYIYYPDSGINHLNILFRFCSTEEEYDKLYNLVLEISKIKIEKKIRYDNFKYKNNSDLYNQCVAHHINYVIRNMRSIKEKGDFEINYGLKLLERIIPILLQNNQLPF